MEHFPQKSDYVQHLQSTFLIEEPIHLELQLDEFSDSSSPSAEQFSLLFTGPESQCLPQGTYTVHHAVLPAHQIFLVPLGPKNRLMRYHCVFSRLI